MRPPLFTKDLGPGSPGGGAGLKRRRKAATRRLAAVPCALLLAALASSWNAVATVRLARSSPAIPGGGGKPRDEPRPAEEPSSAAPPSVVREARGPSASGPGEGALDEAVAPEAVAIPDVAVRSGGGTDEGRKDDGEGGDRRQSKRGGRRRRRQARRRKDRERAEGDAPARRDDDEVQTWVRRFVLRPGLSSGRNRTDDRRSAELAVQARSWFQSIEQRAGSGGGSARGFPMTITVPTGLGELEKPPKRKLDVDEYAVRAQNHIRDDNHYPDPPSQEECVPVAPWRDLSFPTCSLLHESDVRGRSLSGQFYHLASGGFNDVFRVRGRRTKGGPGDDKDVILKLLSPGKKHLPGIPNANLYSKRNYDLARLDALVPERLASSPHVQPLYAHCGFASIVPYADGGTLADGLTRTWSPELKRRIYRNENVTSATRLKYASDAATALADVHDLGVVHADLTVRQYMIRDGSPELADFNRGVVLERNVTDPHGSRCTFLMTENYGTTRAPEEYLHRPQTSAVDVWSLGSVLYRILTGTKPWGKVKKHQAQEAVARGERPEIPPEVSNGTDLVDKMLMRALDLCYVYDPSKRATAREVATFLQNGMEAIDRD
ncbi:hypothetical protein ACHAWF_003502 [Thalassiosira exigua]